jgi:hypothetical protein
VASPLDEMMRRLGANPVEVTAEQVGERAAQTGDSPAAMRRATKALKPVTDPIVGTVAGLAHGALTNPIIALAARPIAPLQRLDPATGQPTPEAAAEAETLEPQTPAQRARSLKTKYGRLPGFKTGAFLGEYAPDVVGAASLLGATKHLGELAMEKAAPRIVARLSPGRTGTLVEQARQLARFATQEAGVLLPEKAPAIYRVGQGLANVAGFAGYSGARSAAAGDDPGTVASHVLEGAQWGLLAETALGAAGYALSKWARPVNLKEAVDHFVWSKAPQVTREIRQSLRTKEGEALEALAKKRVALESERQVLTFAKDIEEQISGRVARTGTSVIPEIEATVAEAADVAKEASMAAERAGHNFRAWQRNFIKGDPAYAGLVRSKPLAEGARGTNTVLALLKSPFPLLAATPQILAGKLGVTGLRVYEALGRSEALFQTAWARKHDEALGFWKEARTIMGKPLAQNGRFFDDVGHAWEKGGAEQVLREFPEQGPKLVDLLQRIKKWRSDLRAPAVKMGAMPNLTDEELAKLGVREQWSHVVRDMEDGEVTAHIAKGLARRLARENPNWSAARVEVTAREMATRSNRYPSDGLAAVGSLDRTRVVPGTLREKVSDGMPFIPDYFESLVADSRAVVRRTAYAEHWGWDAELSKEAVKLVAAEGGSETLMQAVLDGFFKVDPSRVAWRRAAQVMTNAQVGAKMTFAVLPNLGQSSNTLALNGIHNVARGMLRLIRGENINRLDHQVASLEGVFQALRGPELGGWGGADWLQRFVDAEMKLSLFTPSEHFNRLLGGASTFEMVKSTLSKAVTGRLRGNELDFARRQFAKFDLNLDAMVQQVRAGAGIKSLDIDMAVYRGAQLSQFMPDLTRRPFGWNKPLGRVLSQFNNFVLGQTNFMRHEVLAEAARGNYKPLATVGIMYPAVGEFVGSTLEWFGREREKRGLGLWLDRIALSGALGLAWSLYAAARWHRSAEMGLGPTVSTGTQTAEALVQSVRERDLGPFAKVFGNWPVVRAVKLLHDPAEWTVEKFEDFELSLGAEGETGSTAPTLEQLRTQRAYGKPRP